MGRLRFSGVSRSVFSAVINSAIILQVAFGPTVLLAADGAASAQTQQKEYSVFTPNLNLDDADFLKSNDQFNENEKLIIEKYFNEPARVTLDLIILARALSEKVESVDNATEKIKSRNSDSEIAIEVPGIGKAEFNSFGYKESGKIFTRFVHYGTGTSYVFLDTDIVPLEKLSPEEREMMGEANAKDEERSRKISRNELGRYTALQQMHTKVHPDEYNPLPNLEEINPEEAKAYLNELIENAKKNPPKKKYDTGNKIKTGRLVKIIAYSGRSQIVKSITEHQRYEDLSPLQRVAIYWKSVKQGTRLNWDYWDHGVPGKIKGIFSGDVLVSLFSTVMQTGVFATLKGFENARHLGETGFYAVLNQIVNVDPLSLLLVGGWAFAFSITPTARNWINVNGSKSAVLFKSFLNSVVFNYIMLVAIHGADVVFSLNAASFNMAFLAISNAIINNFGKVWWYKIPQIRQRAGLNLNEVNIGKFKTKVDQSSMEQQVWYLGSNVFRTADLLAMGTLFSVLSLDFTLSRVAMLLTIPTMHYLIMKYAERNDFKEKKLLRAEWEKANYLHWEGEPILLRGHKIPILYLGALPMFVRETWMIAKSSFMLAYWPGKVAFDALKAAGEYTLEQLSFSSNKNSQASPERSESRVRLCKSLFGNI